MFKFKNSSEFNETDDEIIQKSVGNEEHMINKWQKLSMGDYESKHTFSGQHCSPGAGPLYQLP